MEVRKKGVGLSLNNVQAKQQPHFHLQMFKSGERKSACPSRLAQTYFIDTTSYFLLQAPGW